MHIIQTQAASSENLGKITEIVEWVFNSGIVSRYYLLLWVLINGQEP
jgi:hypothetical protein